MHKDRRCKNALKIATTMLCSSRISRYAARYWRGSKHCDEYENLSNKHKESGATLVYSLLHSGDDDTIPVEVGEFTTNNTTKGR